jgi:hypothetical protein
MQKNNPAEILHCIMKSIQFHVGSAAIEKRFVILWIFFNGVRVGSHRLRNPPLAFQLQATQKITVSRAEGISPGKQAKQRREEYGADDKNVTHAKFPGGRKDKNTRTVYVSGPPGSSPSVP